VKVNLDLSKVDDYYTRAVLRQVADALKSIPEYKPVVPSTPWDKFTVKVPPTGQFFVCDVIPLDKFISLKYIVTIVNNDQSKVRSLEMTVVNKKTNVFEYVFGVIGDSFNYDITTIINSSNQAEMVYRNLGTEDVSVVFARIIL
jgi:hypothetical protein